MNRSIRRRRQLLDAQTRLLSSVSHENVLARGFVIVQKMTGELVRRAADVESGERLKLQFADDEQRVTADAIDPTAKPRIVVRRGTGSGTPPSANPTPEPEETAEASAPPSRPRIVSPKDSGGQGSLF